MKYLSTILFISIFTNLSFAQCEDFGVEIEIIEPLCYGAVGGGSLILSIDGALPYAVLDITDSTGEKLNLDDSEFLLFVDPAWYYIYLEDADGCIFNDSVQITEPAEIVVDLTITNSSDFDECDGAVQVDTVYNYQGEYEAIFYDWCSGGSGVGISEISEVCNGPSCLNLTDDQGCVVYINFEIGSLAGIHDNNPNDLQVFANPQTGELNILNNEIQNMELSLFNLSGEVVFSRLINGLSAVFMPPLETGVYLYTLSHNGEHIQSGKLNF